MTPEEWGVFSSKLLLMGFKPVEGLSTYDSIRQSTKDIDTGLFFATARGTAIVVTLEGNMVRIRTRRPYHLKLLAGKKYLRPYWAWRAVNRLIDRN